MSKDSIYYVPKGSPVQPDDFDLRVVQRHLSTGKVSHEAYQEHLKGLKDDAGAAETLNYNEVVGEEESVVSSHNDDLGIDDLQVGDGFGSGGLPTNGGI